MAPSSSDSSLPEFCYFKPPQIHLFHESITVDNSSGQIRPRIRFGTGTIIKSEAKVTAEINLDGFAVPDNSTGVSALDGMLNKFAFYAAFEVRTRVVDAHYDVYHLTEDVGLALGNALSEALADKRGITGCGDFSAVHDEALVQVSLDLSGGPHFSCVLSIAEERFETYDPQLVVPFFGSLVKASGMTVHIQQIAGSTADHIIEATCKAFARALRQATEYETRRGGSLSSSQGVF